MLLLFGMAWMLQGVYLLLTRNDYVFNFRQAIPHEAIPWPCLGLLWLGFGCIGACIGFVHPSKDHLGFLAISAMPMLFTASYLTSFITWVVTFGSYGWPFGCLAAFIWGCVSVLIGVLSSWPEPEPELCLPPGDGDVR